MKHLLEFVKGHTLKTSKYTLEKIPSSDRTSCVRYFGVLSCYGGNISDSADSIARAIDIDFDYAKEHGYKYCNFIWHLHLTDIDGELDEYFTIEDDAGYNSDIDCFDETEYFIGTRTKESTEKVIAVLKDHYGLDATIR